MENDNQPSIRLQQEVARRISRRREEMGLSLSQMSRETGIHRTYISNIEKGRANPTIGVLESISKCLNCYIEVDMPPIEEYK